MILFTFTKTTRSYATHAAAVAAAKKAFPSEEKADGIRCVIQSDGARFSPVFFLSGWAANHASHLAGCGFLVIA